MRVGLGFDHQMDRSDETIAQVVHRTVVEALIGAAGFETGAAEEARSVERERSDLEEAVRHLERRNYQVVNLDVTLIPGGPMGRSVIPGLRDELAAAIHVAPGNVSIKQARGGTWAAEDGIAAMSVVLIGQIADLDALHASIRSGG